MTDSLNLLNSQENGLSVRYNSTEDFVKALSKYLKTVKICSKTELNQCLPYDIITVERNGTTTNINTNELSTAASLHLVSNGFEDTAGLIMADGTTMILSYNQECISDPDKAYHNISECVAGIYDINGPQRPNKFGITVDNNGKVSSSTDIKSFNGATLTDCLFSSGNLCVKSVHHPTSNVSLYDCEELKENNMYGITLCRPGEKTYYDSWLNSTVYCGQNDAHLPSFDEMDSILKVLYGVKSVGNHRNNEVITADINKPVALALGFNVDTADGNHRTYWTSYSYGNGDSAYSVVLRKDSFKWYAVNRNAHNAGFCIEN